MSTSEKQKMLAGGLYRPDDPEIQADLAATADWLDRYNAPHLPSAARQELLRERLAAVGDNVTVRPPFHCDFGFNISLGSNVFLNFNCVVLDVTAVAIGDGTQVGPAVQIVAGDHPRDPALRKQGLELGRPVRIGRNVWIGGGVIILPGVEVGDDSVIGAGSVVTRPVPAGATVVGIPARPARGGHPSDDR